MSANSDDTVPSVAELATGNVKQLTSWMASRDGKTNDTKLAYVLCTAAGYGNYSICKAIIDRRRLSDEHMTNALIIVCTRAEGISVAKLIVRRRNINKTGLQQALLTACIKGHVKIIDWLLHKMKLSRDERVKWWLATASACGDIESVTAWSAHVERDHTNVMSYALRIASYNGKVDVVDWLMTHTTADVGLCGEIPFMHGTMTSLAIACIRGHADVVKTLSPWLTLDNVNIQCGDRMDTALHSAIWYKGPKWNRSASLHGACERDDREQVTSLLRSADVNEQDGLGCTPLHIACQNDDKYIIQALLAVFARTDITDDKKQTPVDLVKNLNYDIDLLSLFRPLLLKPDSTDTVLVIQQAVSDVNISEAHSATRGNEPNHTTTSTQADT